MLGVKLTCGTMRNRKNAQQKMGESCADFRLILGVKLSCGSMRNRKNAEQKHGGSPVLMLGTFWG
jgi:hypothetical protein